MLGCAEGCAAGEIILPCEAKKAVKFWGYTKLMRALRLAGRFQEVLRRAKKAVNFCPVSTLCIFASKNDFEELRARLKKQ